MIEFKLLPFHEVSEFIAHNLQEHYSETLEDTPADKPMLDWDYFLDLSNQGQCVCVTAFDNEKVIGYSCFTIGNDPHHRNTLQANNEAFFIKKEHRGKRVGLDLIKRSTEILNNMGIKDISYVLSSSKIGNLLERAGFKQTHVVWSKK